MVVPGSMPNMICSGRSWRGWKAYSDEGTFGNAFSLHRHRGGPGVHRLGIDRPQHLVGRGCNESAVEPERPWLLGALAAGLPLNIGLETAKWHALRARGDKPWTTSLREVLVGATFALVTPNRTGDAVARVALLPANERPSGTQAWLLSAWAQAGWTLTLGTAAWWACTASGQIHLPIPVGAQWTVLAGLLPRAQFGGSCLASPALRGASIGGWSPVGASPRAVGRPQQHRGQIVSADCAMRYSPPSLQPPSPLGASNGTWRSTPPSPWFTLGT